MDIDVDKQKLLLVMPLDPSKAIVDLGSADVLIIDEAQRLPEISRTVKGWYDSGTFSKVILSGSSSLNVLDHSAESLTGRNIKLFLPPLVFFEILTSQTWYSPGFGESIKISGAFARQIDSLLLTSLVFGSYPETIVTSYKEVYLNNLISDFLLKDILQFGLVKTPELLRSLLRLLAHQLGSVVSTNELSRNLGVSRITIERYLDLLEETFVIFRLGAYSTNPRKEIAKSKKIFFWDNGVRNALIGEYSLNPLRSDIGQLWENWVVSEFAKRNLLDGNLNKLYFWRSRVGSEVDLIIKDVKSGELKAYEIKWSPGKTTKAFSARYKVPVSLVHRENFISFLL